MPITPACPRCGSLSREIVYGLPGSELFEAADRGEVILGGCEISDEAPAYACSGVDCGIRFGRLREPSNDAEG